MPARRSALRSGVALVLSYALLVHAPGSARAVCRVVEPPDISGGVEFDAKTMVLYVLAPEQVVGHACQEPSDAGVLDAGARDAGAMTMMPGNPMPTPKMLDLDGGSEDAGFEDVGLDAAAPPAIDPPPMTRMPEDTAPRGSCPDGSRPENVLGSVVHIVLQPAVLSAGGSAGLVMPVPARPDIHAPADKGLFAALTAQVQPVVVHETEYIEDESLGYQCSDPKFGSSSASSSNSGGGCGGDDGAAYDYGPIGTRDAGLYDPGTEKRDVHEVLIGDDIILFEEALSTPDYDVQVINASSASALTEWLDLNGFGHDAEDDAAFGAYVAEGSWFVALHVHPVTVRALQPLVISFRGQTIPLPHRLQYRAGGGLLTTEAFVMAKERMAPSDGSAETVFAAPAGFGGAAAGFGLPEGWLTYLRFERNRAVWMEDAVLRPSPGGELRPLQFVTERIRIPSSQCPGSAGGCGGSSSSPSSSDGDGCVCRSEQRSGSGSGTLAPILLSCLWLRLRGRRRR